MSDMERSRETPSPATVHKPSISSFRQARQKLSSRNKLKISSPRLQRPSTASEGTSIIPSSLQLPLDIGDSQWLEGFHQRGYLDSNTPSPSASSFLAIPSHTSVADLRSESAPQQHIASDLARLSVDDPPAPHRSSSESVKSASSAINTAATSTMRRHTKTPIFRLAHLERKSSKPAPMTRRQMADAAGKTRSIDLIAEQYNALLESRDALEYEALFGDMSPHQEEGSSAASSSRSSSRHTSTETLAVAEETPLPYRAPQYHPYHQQGIKRPSRPKRLPTNDHGELIGFEEDVIYFKPVSFSPEPSPPSKRQQFDRRSPSPTRPRGRPQPYQQHERSSSRAKCEDLLAREISSSVMTGLNSATAEESALQLGIMIKTYERLRDQVSANTEDADKETLGVKSVFDSWLTTLNSVHEKLVNEAVGTF